VNRRQILASIAAVGTLTTMATVHAEAAFRKSPLLLSFRIWLEEQPISWHESWASTWHARWARLW
jgi:hypothetical protein